MTKDKPREAKFHLDKLNLLIAICAIAISLASFYATYLQASAAEKQVKAMTLPLISFGHGNYDPDSKKNAINLIVSNSGMGAAIVHSVNIIYQGEKISSWNQLLTNCCGEEFEHYQKLYTKQFKSGERKLEDGGFVSETWHKFILKPQSDMKLLTLYMGNTDQGLWQTLNNERWQMTTEICYCSLLDDCFLTDGDTSNVAVDSCS